LCCQSNVNTKNTKYGTQVINQEILLFTGSGFCSRQFSKRDSDTEGDNDYSAMEELEKACWDGMLYEMLPELAGIPGRREQLHLEYDQRREFFVYQYGALSNDSR
jgi:hypothetical protein